MGKTLSDEIEGYNTNVNLIKFLCAIMVIMAHSFVLSENAVHKEWFFLLTHGQLTMGTFAVAVFFFFSGLYISKSLDKNSSVKHFVSRRIWRIFPPLILVVFLCVFLMGPVVTRLSPRDYFTNADTWKYLLNCFAIRIHDLPGVFEYNCYLSTVNGSLWTIPLELACYLMCFLMFISGCAKKAVLPFFIFVFGFLAVSIWYVPSLYIGSFSAALLPVMMFLQGMLYFTTRDKIRISILGFILSVLLILVANEKMMLFLGLSLALPYVLTYLSFLPYRVPKIMAKPGEWSYGIYLCAFPIQQMIVFYHGGIMDIYRNMKLSIPATILAGCVVHLVTDGRKKSVKV